MRSLNYLFSVVVALALPLMIAFLSSALVLTLPSTYQFHFNDGNVVAKTGYAIDDGQLTKEISLYFAPIPRDEFQILEDNGEFQDPIFTKKEQKVMSSAKKLIGASWLLGLLFSVAFGLSYRNLYKKGFKEALRNRFKLGFALTIGTTLINGIIIGTKFSRVWLYKNLIGIKLPKDSTLNIILGSPFEKTYLVFMVSTSLIMVLAIGYFHHKLTKPERIFY